MYKLTVLALSSFFALGVSGADAQRIVTSNFGSTFFELNESTAEATEIPREFLTPFFSSSDFRSSTQLFGLQGFTLYQVDFDFSANSYTFNEVLDLSSGSDSIAFDPSGDLFVYNSGGQIASVDINTGEETLVTLDEIDGRRVSFQGIDFSPSGELFGVDTRALYKIDPVTGDITRITATGNDAIPSSIFTELDYSDSGIIRAITFGDTVWHTDPVSGLGQNPIEYSGSVFSSIATTAIPEPSTSCILGLFCLGMSLCRRKSGR